MSPTKAGGKRRQRERPLVTFACVCEKVLQEKDGIVSLIRVADTFHLSQLPLTHPVPPGAKLPPPRFELTVAFGLKAGPVRGRHQVGLAYYKPSGEKQDVEDNWPVVFDDDYSGANYILRFFLTDVQPGDHRFEVLFDRARLTSITFRVLVPDTKSVS